MKIKISNLVVYAAHGVHDFEKQNKQRFVFDVEYELANNISAFSDNLADTVNYSSVCDTIAYVAENNCFNLIERLAREVAMTILEKYAKIKCVYVTVHKPEAPVKRKFKDISASYYAECEVAYLSLGSSLGDRKAQLDRAVSLLRSTRGVRVDAVSDYIETVPYGGVAQNNFLNAAVKIATLLSPRELLNEIHNIEHECGRVRTVRWDDRTLDIDIILFGNKTVDEDDLKIPHPEYKKRDFVLIPLRQIKPDLK